MKELTREEMQQFRLQKSVHVYSNLHTLFYNLYGKKTGHIDLSLFGEYNHYDYNNQSNGRPNFTGGVFLGQL